MHMRALLIHPSHTTSIPAHPPKKQNKKIHAIMLVTKHLTQEVKIKCCKSYDSKIKELIIKTLINEIRKIKCLRKIL